MKTQYKRKKLIVDSAFQTKFMTKFSVITIISSLLIGGFIYFLSSGSTTVAIENTQVVIKNTSDFIFPVLASTVIIVAFLSAVIVLIQMLYLTHQIAGPAFRLNKEIDMLRKGKLGRTFTVRTKDQLQPLAKNLNDLAKSLNDKHVEIQQSSGKLKDFLGEKKFKVGVKDSKQLEKLVKELNDAVSHFQVR